MNSPAAQAETDLPSCEERVSRLTEVLRERLPGAGSARVLVIAGSGLGGFVRAVQVQASVPYAELPHVGASTVAGHPGSLVYGRIGAAEGGEGTPLLLMNGRRHLYEGITPADATLLLRALLVAWPGLRSVIISNAAGGLNRTFEIADLMLISDHVNWMHRNPLIGHNVEPWGPRFPDLSDVYSRRLRALAREAAREAGVTVREGVYIAGHGPSYETRAEVGFFRNILGGDAVGMSTVPEALVCAHMGREALGISFISNLIIEPGVTTHEEVIENSRKVEDKFRRLLLALIPKIA